jgi:hypothetical protein
VRAVTYSHLQGPRTMLPRFESEDDPPELNPFEEALRRLDDAYERALEGLVQRYNSLDHAVLESIGRGMVPPAQEVDALLSEMGIRVTADCEKLR